MEFSRVAADPGDGLVWAGECLAAVGLRPEGRPGGGTPLRASAADRDLR